MVIDLKNRIAIATLKKEREIVPQYSAFGDNNHLQIDVAIDYLSGKRSILELERLYDYDEHMDLFDFINALDEYLCGNEMLEDIIWNSSSVVGSDALNDALNEGVNEGVKTLVCKKMCNDCPFSKKSLKGFLADYSINDFQQYMNNEISFPCHKIIKDDTSVSDVDKQFKDGTLHFCRGYVESVIKSCKMPRTNKGLIDSIKIVREQGLSEDSMSMIEFMKHHEYNTNK